MTDEPIVQKPEIDKVNRDDPSSVARFDAQGFKEEKFETDVKGVAADGYRSLGTEKFPIFNVPQEDFYQNMENGRKRIRFKAGTEAQKYHSQTKYNRPFYVQYKDSGGKSYIRKIK